MVLGVAGFESRQPTSTAVPLTLFFLHLFTLFFFLKGTLFIYLFI